MLKLVNILHNYCFSLHNAETIYQRSDGRVLDSFPHYWLKVTQILLTVDIMSAVCNHLMHSYQEGL